jgi:protein phosphatase
MDCEYEGATCTLMLTWRCPSTGRLYVQTANVGDSNCALGRPGGGGGGGAAQFLTTEHKVTSERERERLARDHGVVLSKGSTRLYGLALARALGDSFLKREGAGLTVGAYTRSFNCLTLGSIQVLTLLLQW